MIILLIYGIARDDGSYSDPDAAIDKYYWYEIGDKRLGAFSNTRQTVVDRVKSGEAEAYTYRNSQIGAKCEVKTSSNGVEYLKTVPNGDPSDNISSLPEM